MNMRLIGARTIADLDESMVDTRALSSHIVPVPSDTLGLAVYDPLVLPKPKL
jgi:L-lactate dehydrogenase (cytochrome)